MFYIHDRFNSTISAFGDKRKALPDRSALSFSEKVRHRFNHIVDGFFS